MPSACGLPAGHGRPPVRPSLTPADVAPLLGTTVPHVRKLARERRIPHYRIGASILFDPDEVAAYLERAHVVPDDWAEAGSAA